MQLQETEGSEHLRLLVKACTEMEAKRRGTEKAPAPETAAKAAVQVLRRRSAAAGKAGMRGPAAAEVTSPEEDRTDEEEKADEEEDLKADPAVHSTPPARRSAEGGGRQSGKTKGDSGLGLRTLDEAGWPSLQVTPLLQPPPPLLVAGMADASLGARLKAALQAAMKANEVAEALASRAAAPENLTTAAPLVIVENEPAWIDLTTSPDLINRVGFGPGSPMEITLEDPPGTLAATAIFLVKAPFPLDEHGILSEARFVKASKPAADAALQAGFPGEGNIVRGWVHTCEKICPSSGATAEGRPLLDAETFRHRLLDDTMEPWAKREMRRAVPPPPSESGPRLMSITAAEAKLAFENQARGERDGKVTMPKTRLEEKQQEEQMQQSVGRFLASRAHPSAHSKEAGRSAVSGEAVLGVSAAATASRSTEVLRQVSGGVSRLKSPAEIAREDSGKRYMLGVEEVNRFLGDRGLAGDQNNEALNTSGIMTHSQIILRGRLPQSQMAHRPCSEIATAESCLDALAAGDLPHMRDLLRQRFRKLEVEAEEGKEQAREALELHSARAVSLAGQAGQGAQRSPRPP